MIQTKIIVIIALIIGAAFALGFTVKFGFIDEAQNYMYSKCIINTCKITRKQCCVAKYNGVDCVDCFDILIDYTFTGFNKTITKSQTIALQNTHICYSPYCTCYYDVRDPEKTLSLVELIPGAGLFCIIILVVFIAILICVLIYKIINIGKNTNNTQSESIQLYK